MVNMYMDDSKDHHPTHTRHGEDDEVEAQRSIRDTYQKMFLEWNPNVKCPCQKVCRVSVADSLAQSVAMKCFAIYASCFRAFVRVD
jgi:hypothetical protein